eukprot:NODE_838_length_2318_cov_24.240547_g713_i0.p1 GENE.NODE_838_length_2318_cov_24.240547_g713_i0~~NODE_838_length_2318_cov_24.240547_g713_i0.p1  ORF type:complete len:517 (-),score=57.10 NODE_838_length_2318_cov_24.240547_g713_i0:767-2260(-)
MFLPAWSSGRYSGRDGFSQEILDFVSFVELSPKERRQRASMIQEVISIIKNLWKNVEVEVFGSWQSGLCLPSSDVDLSITKHPNPSAISDLTGALEKNDFECKFLANAKVPILKFKQRSTGVKGDISFFTDNAAQSAELVKGFLQSCPAARPLIIVLKAFLRAADLNNVYTGGLSSYTITLLVISFLQMHPYYKVKEQRERYALSDLLIDFFAFYGKDFNYHSTTISLLNGGKYCPKRPHWEDPEKPYLLSIIDPLNPTNDVSRGSFAVPRVRSHLYMGYLNMQKCKMHTAPSLLSSIFDVDVLIQHNIVTFDRCVARCLNNPCSSWALQQNLAKSLPKHKLGARAEVNDAKGEEEEEEEEEERGSETNGDNSTRDSNSDTGTVDDAQVHIISPALETSHSNSKSIPTETQTHSPYSVFLQYPTHFACQSQAYPTYAVLTGTYYAQPILLQGGVMAVAESQTKNNTTRYENVEETNNDNETNHYNMRGFKRKSNKRC